MVKFLRKIFIVLLVVLLSGCGSDTTSLQKKTYSIGVDRSWYPLNLYGRNQAMFGFSSDLLRAIAKEEGIRIELITTSSQNLPIGLYNNTFSGILSSILPTTTTKQQYVFSNPYFRLGPVLMVKENSGIRTIDDARNRIIGIDDEATLLFAQAENPIFLTRPYENILQGLQDLENSYIDGVLLNALEAASYIRGVRRFDLKIITTPLTEEGLRLIARPSPEGEFLISTFDAGLQKIKESGTYDELLKKWNLENTEKIEEMVEEVNGNS